MAVALPFLLKYGYAILFAWVLLEQIGLPVPSVPLLLTAGTLTATHRMHPAGALFCAVLACLVSDSAWFVLGGRYGGAMVKLLCRITLEPATCVRKTQTVFARDGARALLWAKFVPGLSAVAAPIAGQSGMPYYKFLLFDGAGSVLWAGSFLLLGRFFGDEILHHALLLHYLSRFAVALFLALVLAFFVYRVTKQRRFLKRVATSRLKPEELKEMLDLGETPFIVDLRHPLDYLPDPRVLPGALRLSPDELQARREELPRDRDIILYCTCPSDASSAASALKLRRVGIERVRPLAGGFEAWKSLGFPLVDYEAPRVIAEGALAEDSPVSA